ncbi:MAG: permease [Ilumatobacter sp.]|uniref:permease n=1 Tax=Ilumatobacter sp. TaxID=1967498 RepID=UPI0026070140|nr:permease [Ilumatobacter sp.]MDJ0768295.1 permease [Ilumatobacter sp.]
MSWLTDLLGRVGDDVLGTFRNVWPFLAIAVVVAAAVPVYVGLDRVSVLLRRKWWLATFGAVALATLTPFCSCGTTAVLLGMIASSSPWAPLVAFMVSSPLTSPSELVFSAGLFGWSFALVFFVGTIVLGVGAGLVAHAIERTGWLAGQARVQPEAGSCSTDGARPPATHSVGAAVANTVPAAPWHERLRLPDYGREVWTLGRRLLVFFFAYTAIGYLMIEAIPTAWLTDHLGGDSPLAVPLAALLGIPVYLNTEGSLPLVATLVDGGMGPGPALAFIVTGAGTSVGAITGLFVIARARVVALVVALLIVGAVLLGWTGQLLL